jgi:hypothetical protein
MVSSRMLRIVTLVRTDVSEELSASIIRVTRICELGTTLAVTNNLLRLLVIACVVPSSQILVTLGFNITEDGILHSHRRENLKSYIALTGWTL